MTITLTLIEIRKTGMSATFNHQTREYRITLPAWNCINAAAREAMAYYTNDDFDAIKTARFMRNNYEASIAARKPITSCGEFQCDGYNG